MPAERGKRKAENRPAASESLARLRPDHHNLKYKTKGRRRIAEQEAAAAAHTPNGNGTQNCSGAGSGGLFENEERDVTGVEKLASFRVP